MSVVFPIEDDDRFDEYTSTEGQTVFSVEFPFQDDNDITVIKVDTFGVETTLTIGSDYTLSGAGEASGGQVTLLSGAAAGDKIQVVGLAVLERLTSIVAAGKFKSKNQDDEHDRHRIIAQELRRDIDRALKPALGATALQPLPAPVAGALLAWNANLDGIENVELVDPDTVVALPATPLAFFQRSADGLSIIGRLAADVKNDIGLGNVDDTSDADKPVSTAQQSALDGKSDVGHTHDDRYYTETEVDALLAGAVGGLSLAAYFIDRKAEGTNGGTFTGGSYQTRELNTKFYDPDNLVTIVGNEFTVLANGWVEWSAPAFVNGAHKSRLYNVTDDQVVQVGSAEFTNAVLGPSQTQSFGAGEVVAGKTYRIEHQCSTTQSSTGFGVAAGFGGLETYTQVKYFT